MTTQNQNNLYPKSCNYGCNTQIYWNSSVNDQHFWLWICIEPIHSSVLGIYISNERNMLVSEKFIRSLVEKYGKHIVYTDGGTWYHEACNVIGLKHYLHSPLEKNLMERVNKQYFKDRIKLNLLMITIHAYKKKIMNAIYYMYITGYNSLYLCIIIQ